MRYSILLLVAIGCTEPNSTSQKLDEPIISFSKGGQGHIAGTHDKLSLKGSQYIKESNMQVKYEEGIPVAAMTFKGDTAISSILFVSNHNKLKYIVITYYDADGNVTLTSEHKVSDDNAFWRLLQPSVANAQTGCWALAGAMTLTAAAVTGLTAEIAAAVASGNLVLAAALRIKYASAVTAAGLASKAWWDCAHTSSLSSGASGGGGGGGLAGNGTRETTTTGPSSGGCYTVLHTLYSTSTNLIISQWQEQICK